MTFSIRKATSEDAEFVLALFERPHVGEYTYGPESIDNFLAVLRRGDRELFVVERNGRPFGHISFAVRDGWFLEIRVIAFEERRTGAGRFTLEWLLRHAFEELVVHRVFLEVIESNEAARALYERVGFFPEGCYRDGYRAGDGRYHNLIPYGILASQYRHASAVVNGANTHERLFSHVDLRVRDAAHALAFYDALLGEFGFRRVIASRSTPHRAIT